MTKQVNYLLTCILLGISILPLAKAQLPSKNVDVFAHTFLTGNLWNNHHYAFLQHKQHIPGIVAGKTYNTGLFLHAADLNSGIGVQVVRETQMEVFTHDYYSLMYRYNFSLNPYVTMYLGAKLTLNQFTTNYTNLQFENNNNEYGIKKYLQPNADLTFATVLYNKSNFGLSFLNLVSYTQTGFNGFPAFVILYNGRYKKQFGNYMASIEPGIHILNLDHTAIFNFGARTLYRGLYAGIRIEQDSNLKFTKLISLLGINIADYSLFYCYDIHLRKNMAFNSGFSSHEVTFLINFRYTNQKKMRKAIKCPDI